MILSVQVLQTNLYPFLPELMDTVPGVVFQLKLDHQHLYDVRVLCPLLKREALARQERQLSTPLIDIIDLSHTTPAIPTHRAHIDSGNEGDMIDDFLVISLPIINGMSATLLAHLSREPAGALASGQTERGDMLLSYDHDQFVFYRRSPSSLMP